MDPQTMAQKTQELDAIASRIASNLPRVETATTVMSYLLVCVLALMLVAMWRRAQHEKAALIAEELAAMRRASWYGRLLRSWRVS